MKRASLPSLWQALSAQFQAGVDKAARLLENDPRLQKLTHQQRTDVVETGNMLFALLHELGHTHIQEMGLPVLGREEDAADAYAVMALFKVGTDVSHNVLVQATQLAAWCGPRAARLWTQSRRQPTPSGPAYRKSREVRSGSITP